MEDESASASLKRSYSRRNTQTNSGSVTRNSTATELSTKVNARSKSTTTKTTTITIRSPASRRKSTLAKRRKSISKSKNKNKNQSSMSRRVINAKPWNLIDSDDEDEDPDIEIEETVDAPVSSSINLVEDDGYLNKTIDSFDSSQTVDIDHKQQQGLQKKTIKSKYDVLNYFTKINNGGFQCNLCTNKSKIFPKSSISSDTNLRSHLGRAHKLDGFLYPSQLKRTAQSEHKVSLQRKQFLDDMAVQAIIQDSHSFNLFRKSGMQNFLSVAMPGYRGPSRQTVVKRLKPLYKENRLQVREKLSTISHIAISIDLWKSNRRSHFLCITGHYFDETFCYHSLLISFRRFHGKHSSGRLERFIEKELDKYDLRSKLSAITTDNGSDIRSATMRLSKFGIKISCILHNLNLVIQNGLWLFKIPKKDVLSSNLANASTCTKTTTDYIDYSTDDDDIMLEKSQDTDDISYLDETCASDAEKEVSDSETTATISSSSSVASELSSSNDSSDEDNIQILPKVFTAEEELIRKASEDPKILLMEINLLMKRVRKLVCIIQKSSVLSRYIDKQIELKNQLTDRQTMDEATKNKYQGFILDMRIRWGSSYSMLCRFLHNATIINDLTHDPSVIMELTPAQCRTLRKLSISSLDWTILKSLEHILSRFQRGIKLLSTRKRPTLSLSHSVMHGITKFLTTADDDPLTLDSILKEHLLSTFNYYYQKHVTDEQKIVTLVSAFLDPFTFGTMDENSREEAEAILLNEDLMRRMVFNSSPTAQSYTKKMAVTANKKQDIDASSISLHSFYEACGIPLQTVSNNNKWSMKEEICYYLSTVDSKEDFSDYWNANKRRLPLLSSVVHHFNIICASSMPSESTFSKSGYVQRKNRSSLAPEVLRYSMILKT